MTGTRLLGGLSVATGLGLWEIIGRLSPPVLFAPASTAMVYWWQQIVTLALPAAIGRVGGAAGPCE